MEVSVCVSYSRASRRFSRLVFCREGSHGSGGHVQKLMSMTIPCVIDKAYLEPALLPVGREGMVKREGMGDSEWSELHLPRGWRRVIPLPSPGQPSAQRLSSLMRNQDVDLDRAVLCAIVESRLQRDEVENNHGLSIDLSWIAAKIFGLARGGIDAAVFMFYIVEFGIDIAAHGIVTTQGLGLPAQVPAAFKLSLAAAIFAIQQGQRGMGMAALRQTELRLIPRIDREFVAKPGGGIIHQGRRHLVPAANIVIVVVPIENIRLHMIPPGIVDNGTAAIEGGQAVVGAPQGLLLFGILRDTPIQAPLLVIDAPDDNAGMIAIARDHRGQLLLKASDRCGRVASNARRFGPYQQTQAVGPGEPARVLELDMLANQVVTGLEGQLYVTS